MSDAMSVSYSENIDTDDDDQRRAAAHAIAHLAKRNVDLEDKRGVMNIVHCLSDYTLVYMREQLNYLTELVENELSRRG